LFFYVYKLALIFLSKI